MWIRTFFISLMTAFSVFATAQNAQRSYLFDEDWRFHRGGMQWAENPAFDDSKWRQLDLPHDWSLENIPGTQSPFDPAAISQVSGGFTVGGTGWYRKSFTLPERGRSEGSRIYLQFDGVMSNAEVWLNGRSLGAHPYGYTSFFFDITDLVKRKDKNIVAVKVRNEGENSRWYTGSGIYRHVWLTITDPLHVAPWGTYITTPEVSDQTATVSIRTKVLNKNNSTADASIRTRILDPKGSEVGVASAQQQIPADSTAEVRQIVTVSKPERWSLEKPALYRAVTEISWNGQVTDRYETVFGIRTISFDAARGFVLNGKPVELKGGCVHHDNGPLGARAYDRAEERRVELLKAS